MSKYMHEYNQNKCSQCSQRAVFGTDQEGNQTSSLRTCLGCMSVEYCSRKCQTVDWPKHKKFCKKFQKLIAEYKRTRDSRRVTGAKKPEKPSPYPLHDFIEKEDWRGLLRFVNEHPTYDVDENDQRSRPGFMRPLLLACGQGQIECADILIRHGGADVTAECNSSNLTPLQYASWWGHDDICRLLLNKGADVNQKNTHETFALGYATSKLQPHVVELLLKYGANPDERNAVGWTSLMQTVGMGHTQLDGGREDPRNEIQRRREDNPKIISIAKMLLDAGADINARGHSEWGVVDFKGETALSFCAENNKIDIMEFLISKGAMLDVQRESDGRNALLAAAEHNEYEAVEVLIRSGADVTVRDNQGRDYKDLLAFPWPRDEDEQEQVGFSF